MKKIISFLIAFSFVVPSLAFAQMTTSSQTIYTSSLRQLISLLVQEVAQLEQQLTALNAKRNTPQSATTSSATPQPTSTEGQPSGNITLGLAEPTSTVETSTVATSATSSSENTTITSPNETIIYGPPTPAEVAKGELTATPVVATSTVFDGLTVNCPMPVSMSAMYIPFADPALNSPPNVVPTDLTAQQTQNLGAWEALCRLYPTTISAVDYILGTNFSSAETSTEPATFTNEQGSPWVTTWTFVPSATSTGATSTIQ